MEELLQLAASNQETAWKVIRENGIVPAWESIGGEVHLVGSLKTGLLLKRCGHTPWREKYAREEFFRILAEELER